MQDLSTRIDHALSQQDPSLCNRAITICHYDLSRALSEILGPKAGANFHSWAVWGSRKAGVTIRQEDLHQARDDAMRAGGASGFVIGTGVARYLSGRTGHGFWYGLGSLLGTVSGAKCAEQIAIWSRRKAAKLVLAGNKLVLNDIGRVTARFCQEFAESKSLSTEAVEAFTGSIDDPLLRQAFKYYGTAALSESPRDKQEAAYFANCLAILYEHQKLQPYIKGAMPLVVRRCVTKRLLSFEIGELSLAVSEDVPHLGCHPFPPDLAELRGPELHTFLQKWDRDLGSTARSAASDWTKLSHRMAYIVDLFRRFHADSNVMLEPYPKSPCG
jgi:hypothetical protein